MIELNIVDPLLFEPFFDAFCEDEGIPFRKRFGLIHELYLKGVALQLLQKLVKKAVISMIVDTNHYGIVLSKRGRGRRLTYFDYGKPMLQIYGLDGKCVSDLIQYYSITAHPDGRAWLT